MIISGKFVVVLAPLDFSVHGMAGLDLGRMLINKKYYGDLQGASKGEMLSVMTATKGSAGYVAIEQFNGSLAGKRGAFVLQHYATKSRGQEYLCLEVVPDSGSGELTGISGKMSIKLEDGQHIYEFDYELA